MERVLSMANVEFKSVTYGSGEDKFQISVPGTLSPEEIQATVAEFFPEVANASYKEDSEGNVTFVKQTGTKGC
jgi:hypothetical protein